MYAIIREDGRQYKVEEGQEIEIDYRDVPSGDQVTFENILLVSGEAGISVGKPSIDGASVTAKVLGPEMGKKIVVQKFRRRKNSRRRTGHRQMFTRVKISRINANGVGASIDE